jgi:NADH-quinone oxidoreductase subunit A
MATPTAIVAYLALFAAVGFGFLFANLLLGRFLRPVLPNVEKLEVYECGEPTIGSSFVQFDLRFYVVALLFIIFDVEVAFFFPWAAVFGKATQLAGPSTPVMEAQLDPAAPADKLSAVAVNRLTERGIRARKVPTLPDGEAARLRVANNPVARSAAAIHKTAWTMALISLLDILVFFLVLMVGFFYVWKRGDLDWVRSVKRQDKLPVHRAPPARPLEPSQSVLSA